MKSCLAKLKKIKARKISSIFSPIFKKEPMISKRKILFIFNLIFLAELLSLFGYFLPELRQAIFLCFSVLVLILSIYKLEYGILILLAELFIDSKGYLFYFTGDGLEISCRIALWIIILAVWAVKFITTLIKSNKNLTEKGLDPKTSGFNPFRAFYNLSLSKYFIILFLLIFWGIVNGFLNNNGFNNVFFDANGWLYFALLFPLADYILKLGVFLEINKTDSTKPIVKISEVFIASTIWLAVKTFFVLFFFSHNLFNSTLELYQWIRNTGVGEITQIQGGFYRVFFQSHIFILIGFFIFLIFMAESIKNKNKKNLYLQFSLASIFLSIILLSFSRSFWVGLAVGLLACFLIILKTYGLKISLKTFSFLPLALTVSAILIFTTVKFPYPKPLGGFDTASLFSDRVSQTNESAISSRWQLLPPLQEAIKENFILGKGFGATVTYESKDPRVLESSADGQYTTYAFEWGWLDIWLKLGILGFISYVVLMGKIIYDGLKTKENLSSGLAIGLLVLAAVSFFSPYTNHPLGIGYLIIAGIIMNLEKKKSGLA